MGGYPPFAMPHLAEEEFFRHLFYGQTVLALFWAGKLPSFDLVDKMCSDGPPKKWRPSSPRGDYSLIQWTARVIETTLTNSPHLPGPDFYLGILNSYDRYWSLHATMTWPVAPSWSVGQRAFEDLESMRDRHPALFFSLSPFIASMLSKLDSSELFQWKKIGVISIYHSVDASRLPFDESWLPKKDIKPFLMNLFLLSDQKARFNLQAAFSMSQFESRIAQLLGLSTFPGQPSRALIVSEVVCRQNRHFVDLFWRDVTENCFRKRALDPILCEKWGDIIGLIPWIFLGMLDSVSDNRQLLLQLMEIA
jgi:hypothetical protein